MNTKDENTQQPETDNSAVQGRMQRIVSFLFRKGHDWERSELISLDGQTIYQIRKKEGAETEVQDRWGRWKPDSQAKFSLLPCFEDYHKRRYFSAVPFIS